MKPPEFDSSKPFAISLSLFLNTVETEATHRWVLGASFLITHCRPLLTVPAEVPEIVALFFSIGNSRCHFHVSPTQLYEISRVADERSKPRTMAKVLELSGLFTRAA